MFDHFGTLKGATKLYFMHTLYDVIILFNTDLYKSAFPTYSFENLLFRLSVFFIFVCSVLNSMSFLKTDNIFLINVYLNKCSVILFSLHKTTCKNKENRVSKNMLPKSFEFLKSISFIEEKGRASKIKSSTENVTSMTYQILFCNFSFWY